MNRLYCITVSRHQDGLLWAECSRRNIRPRYYKPGVASRRRLEALFVNANAYVLDITIMEHNIILRRWI